VHVIPIAIAGTESDNWYGWWLENYEVHLAGLGVTDAIERGDLKALDSSPVIASAKAMQALVSSNAFEPGYTSASQANDIPYALLGSNQAAMMLFGVFATGFVQKVAPTFTTNGDMGWFSFPAVNGGSGNQIIDLATVPLLVINKNMPQTDIAASEQFIKDFDYSDAQIRSLAKVGDVGFASSSISVIKSVAPKSQLSYMEFQVNEAIEAKQSFVKWGSLLPTSVTSAWDSLLEELFTLKITPQAFAVAASKL
jgi:raffinose/stachyose/melibiose transport system substrate-binding protein